MNGLNEQLFLDVLERVRYRYYGKYRGSVTDVDAGTLRIKAKVPAVLGEQKTGWCMPCLPYAGKDVGLVFLPETGTGVWIEFEGGDVSYPIWVGCYFREGESPADITPTVKAIITKAGHKILLDDVGESVSVTDANENSITMDSSGLTLERRGKKVVISQSGVDVNDGALEVL